MHACICACIGFTVIDEFNMSLNGVTRTGYAQSLAERSAVLMSTTSGCSRQIKYGDPCFRGSSSGVESVVCNARVLTLSDECWYHGRQSYKHGDDFIKDPNVVTLARLVTFLNEVTVANHTRYLGKAVPPSLVSAMKAEVKARRTALAATRSVRPGVPLAIVRNPFLHDQVLCLS
jgi:hypothetical protein